LVFVALLSLAIAPAGAQEAEEAVSAEPEPETATEQDASSPLDELRALPPELERLQRRYEESEGELRRLYGGLLLSRSSELDERLSTLVEQITEGSLPEGVEPEEASQLAEEILEREVDWLFRAVDAAESALVEGVNQLDTVTGAERIDLEETVRFRNSIVTELLRRLVENLEQQESLGMSTESLGQRVDRRLQERAEIAEGHILVTQRQIADLRERDKDAPDAQKADIQTRLASLAEGLDRAQETLEATIDLMKSRGLETEELQQVLVESEGTVSADILNPRVAARVLERAWDRVTETVISQGPQWLLAAITFVLVVLVAWLLSRSVRRFLGHWFERSPVQTSQLLQQFAIAMASKAILIVGLLIALSQLGIELGPALAGLGIAGIAIGFALQDTLSNFASGIMILIYRPFDVGDILDAGGVSGTVRDMNLVSTTILTFDNRTLIVPNNKIWGDTIQNVTAQAHRRVDLEFGVSYDDDLELVEKVLRQVVEEHEMVLEEPAPIIKLHRMDDSALVFICRPWTERDHYWNVYWDVMSRVKEQFDAHGISIPFPQRDVHLYRSGAAEGGPAAETAAEDIEDEGPETESEPEESPPPNDV
jgi:small conductance mechanosensitive channel